MGFLNAEKCDWCGGHVSQGDVASVLSFATKGGKHFCSKACESKYKASKSDNRGIGDAGTSASQKRAAESQASSEDAARKHEEEMALLRMAHENPEAYEKIIKGKKAASRKSMAGTVSLLLILCLALLAYNAWWMVFIYIIILGALGIVVLKNKWHKNILSFLDGGSLTNSNK